MEGDGRASRDKQRDEKASIKGKAQRTHIPRAAGCPVTWCWMLRLLTSASAPWVGSSNPAQPGPRFQGGNSLGEVGASLVAHGSQSSPL